jgi:hypothetical protein
MKRRGGDWLVTDGAILNRSGDVRPTAPPSLEHPSPCWLDEEILLRRDDLISDLGAARDFGTVRARSPARRGVLQRSNGAH